jgi:hypothetical protein
VAGVTAWARVVLIGSSGDPTATWDIRAPGRAELAVVDALARCQLAARRAGGSIRVTETSRELAELLDLLGLGPDVLGWGCPP